MKPIKALQLEPRGGNPNNPRLPVMIYEAAFSPAAGDLARQMEQRFADNAWPPQWCNGIYAFHHYHAKGHEVLGIAAGHAVLIIGGDGGKELRVSAGDVLVLRPTRDTAAARPARICSSSELIRPGSGAISCARRLSPTFEPRSIAVSAHRPCARSRRPVGRSLGKGWPRVGRLRGAASGRSRIRRGPIEPNHTARVEPSGGNDRC